MNESGCHGSAGGGIKALYARSRSDTSDTIPGKRFKGLRDFQIFGGSGTRRSPVLSGFLISHLAHCHRLCSASEFSPSICSCSAAEEGSRCGRPRRAGKDTADLIESKAGQRPGLGEKSCVFSEADRRGVFVAIANSESDWNKPQPFWRKGLDIAAEATKANKSDRLGKLTNFWLAATGQPNRPQSHVQKRVVSEDSGPQGIINTDCCLSYPETSSPGQDVCHEEPSKPPTDVNSSAEQSHSHCDTAVGGPVPCTFWRSASRSSNPDSPTRVTSLEHNPSIGGPITLLQRPKHLWSSLSETSTSWTSPDKETHKESQSAMLPMGSGPTLVEPSPQVVAGVGVGRLSYISQAMSNVDGDISAASRSNVRRRSFGRVGARVETPLTGSFRSDVMAHLARCQPTAPIRGDSWMRSDSGNSISVPGDVRLWNKTQVWSSGGGHPGGAGSQQRPTELGHSLLGDPSDLTMPALHGMATRSTFGRHSTGRSAFGATPSSCSVSTAMAHSLLRQRLDGAAEQQLGHSTDQYLQHPSYMSSVPTTSSSLMTRVPQEPPYCFPLRPSHSRQPMTTLLHPWGASYPRSGPPLNGTATTGTCGTHQPRLLLPNDGGGGGPGLNSLHLFGLSPNHRHDRQGVASESADACSSTSRLEESSLLREARHVTTNRHRTDWIHAGLEGSVNEEVVTKRFSCHGPRHRRVCSSQIVNVWAENLEEEFARIRDVVERYQYIAMDTEFPGIVARPTGVCSDYHYKTIKFNVDLLKVIQLGISFADERGNNPAGTCTWQFNFKFDLNRDMYAQDSIDFLRHNGVDFEVHQNHGIDIHQFGELIISSGLVMNKDVKWVSFHGSYDFGYLLKLLTCAPLPTTEAEFFDLLRDYFPALYDIKFILQNCPNLNGGISLQKIAEHLDVRRIGRQHQAGSDSLVTCHTFFRLMDLFFDNLIDDSIFSGVIYGLGGATNNGTPGRRKSICQHETPIGREDSGERHLETDHQSSPSLLSHADIMSGIMKD